VPTILDQRYDAFIHCDHSEALRPLHQFELAEDEKETHPFAE
jgi:erythromycin esterase